jgi:transcriptional antiterminator Rof (Rho-off)
MMHMPVTLIAMNGEKAKGKAINLFISKERKECIDLLDSQGGKITLELDSMKYMEANVNNRHFSRVKLND